MASSSTSQNSAPKVIETIVEAGKKAFEPNLDAAARTSGLEEYNRVIERYAHRPRTKLIISENTNSNKVRRLGRFFLL